jgi:Ca2+-binding EF-hand superfamily protein
MVRRAALALFAGAATLVTVSAQGQGTMRFASMDANNDGVITRREWKGNARSFRVHDLNGDGILSGDEVRQPARRATGTEDRVGEDRPREDLYRDWTAQGFAALDRNRDNRISRDEWQSDLATFRRADVNRDGALTRAEFLGDAAAEDDSRRPDAPLDRFDTLDTNNDRRISRAEWRGTAERFDLLDTNRDAVITRQEFGGTAAPARSEAWTQGRDRGLLEGREAGKADRARNTWDLEGQRELETADAGYNVRFGSKEQYQAGYREGFRRGYREGYGPR